jgi:hypothetical protein
MRLLTVPARQGAVWVRRGFQVFVRQPLAFSGLFIAFLFVVFLLTVLPLLGPLLVLALLPIGSLGFMIATQGSLRGRFPLPRVFVEPLRAGRSRAIAMLQLGLIYAVCSVAIITLSDTIDGGALEALMDLLAQGKATPDSVAQQLGEARLQFGLIVRFGLAALLSVPFWHAPALVHWGTQGVAQSLFSSTLACWRNMGAFSVFGLVWLGVVLAFALLANLLALLLGQAQLVALLAMPASLILSTIFYASLYFSFADCFELPGAPRTEPTPTDTAVGPPTETP